MTMSFSKKMGMLQIVLFTLGAVLLVVGLGVKAKTREAAARTQAEIISPASGEPGASGGATEVVLDQVENQPVDETDVVTPVTPEVSCEFGQWVGHAVDESAVKATGRPYRILPPGSMVTMDYQADRLNVETDEKGIVTRVSCG